ncbi:MAG: PilZ domain-containing protein [Pseudomonadota bacterium]|nr:PilZ domain-containing protein [Xanthomonadaceae bacterium]MDE2249257.1 PilZ domain-containing protein [Xanthomonadaceae bacterium]MDE3210044.1 PilZ domain-containing protein [Pseudomonadota bacterium]
MNRQATPNNQRRAQRKRAVPSPVVTNAITGQRIGQVGNLSSTGMMLILQERPRREALYQVSVALPSSGRALLQSQPIEIGIQEQWQEAAASSDQIWAGFRIIAITDVDATRLEGWLAQA